MSHIKVVKLRAVLDSMNDQEFFQFIQSLTKQCGRDVLITPLCNQINKKNAKTLETAITTSHDIVASRKESISVQNQQNKLDLIPSELIGEIGSYLSQQSYFSLSTTNRALYIGCNDPNRMEVLDLLLVKDYSCIELMKYPSLKHLKLILSQFDQLSLTLNKKLLRRLAKLTLSKNEDRVDEKDIQNFCSQTSMDLSKVKDLTLTSFGQEDCFSFKQFKMLLLLFPDLENLALDWVDLSMTHNTTADIKSIIPKLTGYADLYGYNAIWTKHLIYQFGSKLRSLQLDNIHEIGVRSNITFSNLEELCLYYPSNADLNHILDTTQSLKRVKLKGAFYDATKWNDLMKRLFETQQSLNELTLILTSDEDLDTISDGLEYGLRKVNKPRTMRLKISCMGGYSQSNTTVLQLLMQADKLRRQMEASFGRHQYILFIQNPILHKKDIEQEVEKFRKENKERLIVRITQKYRLGKETAVAIYDKQCMVDGWQNNWIIDINSSDT